MAPPAPQADDEAEAQLAALESKVRRALDVLAQTRKSREASQVNDRDNTRLREQLSEQSRQSAEAERARAEARRRLERLVKQIDVLTGK